MTQDVITADPNAARGGITLDDGRAWYTLGMLTFAYALAYVDRQMLNLLVEPIKRSLLMSDTQFSLIQGSAFILGYLAVSPVFGRLADVANRRNILIFGVCSWSVSTALCGTADTFGELFLARCGVGVTEACIFPVSWSLIADYFSNRRAARAYSIFALGAQLGAGFSLVVGGLIIALAADLRSVFAPLANLEAWQIAFITVGVPGLAFALFLLTLREPPRTKLATDERPGLRAVASTLWERRSFYLRIYCALGSVAIVQLGIPAWLPAFLMRVHGLSPTQTGYTLGPLSLVVATGATLLGPVVAGRLFARGYTDAPLRACAFVMIGMFGFCAAIPLMPTATGALLVAGGAIACNSFPVGLMAFATQHVTPNRMRGVVASLYTFTAQLVGYALGPALIAGMTDRVFRNPAMVGYSLQIVTCIATAIAGLLFFSILRPYRESVASVTENSLA